MRSIRRVPTALLAIFERAYASDPVATENDLLTLYRQGTTTSSSVRQLALVWPDILGHVRMAGTGMPQANQLQLDYSSERKSE